MSTKLAFPYSPSTGCTYLPGLHTEYPADLIFISEECYRAVIANPEPGKIRAHHPDGTPYLVDPAPQSVEALCQRIDVAASECARLLLGDPLRVLEYERAASGARAFRDKGFPDGEIPAVVAAWAINGRSAQEAAEEIIRRADEQASRFDAIRELRLAAKGRVRQLVGDLQAAQAESAAAEQQLALLANPEGA